MSSFQLEQVDQVEEGIAILLDQFRDNADVVALVSMPLRCLNDVEAAVQAFLKLTSIDDAAGVWLDLLGRILRQPRGQKVDAVYRLFLKAKVAALASNGSVPGLYSVPNVLDAGGTYKLSPEYPANIRMSYTDPPLAEPDAIDRAQLMKVAKAGGVGFFFFYLPDTPANTFQFFDNGVGGPTETPLGDMVLGDDPLGYSPDAAANSGHNGFGSYWADPDGGDYGGAGGGGRLAGIILV